MGHLTWPRPLSLTPWGWQNCLTLGNDTNSTSCSTPWGWQNCHTLGDDANSTSPSTPWGWQKCQPHVPWHCGNASTPWVLAANVLSQFRGGSGNFYWRRPSKISGMTTGVVYVGIMGMTRAVWVGHGLPGLIARTASVKVEWVEREEELSVICIKVVVMGKGWYKSTEMCGVYDKE